MIPVFFLLIRAKHTVFTFIIFAVINNRFESINCIGFIHPAAPLSEEMFQGSNPTDCYARHCKARIRFRNPSQTDNHNFLFCAFVPYTTARLSERPAQRPHDSLSPHVSPPHRH
jgi:hypothetical protein